MFSLSLSPPQDADVPVSDFEDALARVEKSMGLEGQPRAVIFHEKEGRRHAHAVWSRIDVVDMKVVPLPFFKTKLVELSRELYIDHGWKMPKGLMNSEERDPASFTLVEWQQAKRTKQHPSTTKEIFKECWAVSDSRVAFEHALGERGYLLAKGDRRGFVAIDYMGEIYAIARMTGQKTKDVKKHLGDPEGLPDLARRRSEISAMMTGMLQSHVETVSEYQQQSQAHIDKKRAEMVRAQRAERAKLDKEHHDRLFEERQQRARQISRGLRGIWDWVTGKRRRLTREHQMQEEERRQQFADERQAMVRRQLEERRTFQTFVKQGRQRAERAMAELRIDVLAYREELKDGESKLRDRFAKTNEIGELSLAHRDMAFDHEPR